MAAKKTSPGGGDAGARNVKAGLHFRSTNSHRHEEPQAADGPRRREAHPIRVELSGSYTARAAGITVSYEKRRRGAPICALARKLIKAGHSPDAHLHIYRRGTLCFEPAPLRVWARLTVKEGNNSSRSARFETFAPPSKGAPESAPSRPSSGRPAGVPDALPEPRDGAGRPKGDGE